MKTTSPKSYAPFRVFKVSREDQNYLLLLTSKGVLYSEFPLLRNLSLQNLRETCKELGLKVVELHDIRPNTEVEIKVGDDWHDVNAHVIGFKEGEYRVIMKLNRKNIRPK